jgi:hypothetical protein
MKKILFIIVCLFISTPVLAKEIAPRPCMGMEEYFKLHERLTNTGKTEQEITDILLEECHERAVKEDAEKEEAAKKEKSALSFDEKELATDANIHDCYYDFDHGGKRVCPVLTPKEEVLPTCVADQKQRQARFKTWVKDTIAVDECNSTPISEEVCGWRDIKDDNGKVIAHEKVCWEKEIPETPQCIALTAKYHGTVRNPDKHKNFICKDIKSERKFP